MECDPVLASRLIYLACARRHLANDSYTDFVGSEGTISFTTDVFNEENVSLKHALHVRKYVPIYCP